MSDRGEERFAGPFWRVFPWNPTAEDGAPFSPRYVLPARNQRGGRFHIQQAPLLYLAETPEHALSEVLQRFAGIELRPGDLLVPDHSSPGTYHSLALVRCWIPAYVDHLLPDLGDGATLHRLGIRADSLASARRSTTQDIARHLYVEGHPGFRWWSALKGDWHSTILFLDRVDVGTIRYDEPEPLSLDHPILRVVASSLKIRLS